MTIFLLVLKIFDTINLFIIMCAMADIAHIAMEKYREHHERR